MMKYFKFHIAFFFVLIFSCSVLAQDENSQSSSDIEKIKKWNEQAYELSRTDHEASLEISERALELSREIEYIDGQINSLLLIGTVYKSIAAYDKAAEYYFDALEIARELDDDARISICLNNIGNVYQAQENYRKSLEYYKMSLEIEEKLKDKEQMSIRYYNIGVVYESLDSLDMALTYYYNSLLLEEEIKNYIGIYYALYGIAGVERQLGRYESAEANINRALAIVRGNNDLYGLAFCYNEKGKLLLDKLNYRQAIISLDSSMYYAVSLGLRQEVLENYFDLAAVYREMQDYKSAYDKLQQYVLLKDTLHGIEIGAKVEEIEARYRVEQKEKEITYLKEMNGLKTQKADSERRSRYFLLIGIFLLLLYSVIKLRAMTTRFISIIFISLLGITIQLLIAYLLHVYSSAPEYSYLNAFADVFMYSAPFLFIALVLSERVLLRRYLARAGKINTELDAIPKIPSSETIVLDFEAKNDEIKLELKDLLLLEANDNYVAVYYCQNNKMKKDLRRGSLKMMEEQLVDNTAMQRCHKSYIVNIHNVNSISGNAQGYKLHINEIEFEIPVSRSFPKAMINKLKSQI